MLLTKYADYSIRVLMYLAQRPGQKVPITTIAETYDISRNHLMKVSQNLARQGYIIGYRGKGGGIALARPARTIPLGEMLEQVEVSLRPRESATGETQSEQCQKNFNAALDSARRAFIDRLSAYSLADIVFSDETSEAPRYNGTNNHPEP